MPDPCTSATAAPDIQASTHGPDLRAPTPVATGTSTSLQLHLSPVSRSTTPQAPRDPPQLQTPPRTQVPTDTLAHDVLLRIRSLTVSPAPRPWPVHPATPSDDVFDDISPAHARPLAVSPTRPATAPSPRVRTSDTHVPNPPLDTLSWPCHALDAYNYLANDFIIGEKGEKVVTARGGGDEWLKCVQGFMEFQRLAGFPVSHLCLRTGRHSAYSITRTMVRACLREANQTRLVTGRSLTGRGKTRFCVRLRSLHSRHNGGLGGNRCSRIPEGPIVLNICDRLPSTWIGPRSAPLVEMDSY